MNGTLLSLWLVGVLATALVAQKRNRNVLGFTALAVVFWPIALILVALGGNYGRRCEACQEVVHEKATICPHCRTALAST